MISKTFSFVKKNWQLMLLGFFILLGGVLRFTNIFNLEFFTYDQARDALFVKRMVVEHEWRLLGTQTSLPGFYLPPFYFYTIAPILWLFHLNPIGIDIYSALIGVASVPLVYFVGNRIFGRPAGIFSAGLFAVSPLVVELTRRAWNPNTLPFFILLSFYFVYQFVKERKSRDLLIAFTAYGYCLSLHFGAWILAPLYLLLWLWAIIKVRLNWKPILLAILIIGFFVLPLLLFEIRHNFLLTNQAKIFFFDGGHIGPGNSNVLEGFITSLVSVFAILISGRIVVGYGAPLEFSGKLTDLFSLGQPISVVAQKPFSLSFQWWGIVILLGILTSSIWIFITKHKDKKGKSKIPFLGLLLIWVWILWGILASKLYGGKFFFFYYLYLFPAPILLFGWFLGYLSKNIVGKLTAITIFIYVIIFHWQNSVVNTSTWRNFDLLKKVGQAIASQVTNKSFNLVTIQKEADRWDRNAVDYRYFVEAYYNKRALDWYPQDYQNAEELYVIDETNQTEVLNSPIMEIQEFNPSTISGQWQVGEGEQRINIIRLEK